MPLTLRSRLLLYWRRPPTAGGVTAEEVLLPDAPVMVSWWGKPTLLACPVSIERHHQRPFTPLHLTDQAQAARLESQQFWYIIFWVRCCRFRTFTFGAYCHVKPIRSHRYSESAYIRRAASWKAPQDTLMRLQEKPAPKSRNRFLRVFAVRRPQRTSVDCPQAPSSRSTLRGSMQTEEACFPLRTTSGAHSRGLCSRYIVKG